MERPQTVTTSVTRVSNVAPLTAVTERRDQLIVEEPLSIQLDGNPVSTTMRTPGHDFELAAGLCFTDGLLAGATITGVRYCTDRHGPSAGEHSDDESDLTHSSNVVNVETGDWAPVAAPRLGKVTSSCGWCGSDQIDELCRRLRPVNQREPLDLPTLAKVVASISPGQPLFEATGAVHCAAVFDREGQVVLVREDVGRHNAVDKVIGALLLEGGRLPAAEFGLFVSGRASIEMVQKAWAAGFGTLLAVSAPTALAVETARRAQMTLVGFARANGFNVYSHGAAEEPGLLNLASQSLP